MYTSREDVRTIMQPLHYRTLPTFTFICFQNTLVCTYCCFCIIFQGTLHFLLIYIYIYIYLYINKLGNEPLFTWLTHFNSMFSYHAIALLLYHVFLFILQRNPHVAFYVQLHIFLIICIDYSDLFTLCLNHYAYVDFFLLAKEYSMSMRLPVALYCSMHSWHHGGGSRSGSGIWLSDGWLCGTSMCVSACMRGRTVDGVRVCNLRRRLDSVVSFTHTVYIASTKAILCIASIMTNNQNVVENV